MNELSNTFQNFSNRRDCSSFTQEPNTITVSAWDRNVWCVFYIRNGNMR